MNPQLPANPLARDLAAGQPAAFAELYDRHARRMLRVAAAMLHDRHAAEDVLHDLFVNLARARERFAEIDDVEAYVFASLRYAIRARISARQRERRRLAQLAAGMAEETETRPAPADDVTAALAELPDEQREVIVLKIDAELTFSQIGHVLGISQNTAASRYRYAIEKLRLKLGERS